MFVPRHSWPGVFLSAVPPHTLLGRVAVCVIRALGHAGWGAHVIHLCLGTRTQRALFVFLFLLLLWPSRDATTITPARASKARML